MKLRGCKVCPLTSTERSGSLATFWILDSERFGGTAPMTLFDRGSLCERTDHLYSIAAARPTMFVTTPRALNALHRALLQLDARLGCHRWDESVALATWQAHGARLGTDAAIGVES